MKNIAVVLALMTGTQALTGMPAKVELPRIPAALLIAFASYTICQLVWALLDWAHGRK